MNSKSVNSILMLLLLVFLAACHDVFSVDATKIDTFLGFTNQRVLIKGSLFVEAFGDRDTYFTITLGSPADPYLHRFPFFIQLPDSTVMDLSAPGAVSALRANSFSPTDMWAYEFYDYEMNKNISWPEGTSRIRVFPFDFFVLNDDLLGMHVSVPYQDMVQDELGNPGAASAMIGSAPNTMIAIPFNSADYIYAFGQPDRILESFKL